MFLISSSFSSMSLLSGAQEFVVARLVLFVFILFRCTFPGCHFSVSMDPAHLQVLLVDFQLEGRESLFFSSSQHSSSALAGCFLPQFLQAGASFNFFLRSSHFFFVSSSDFFSGSFFSLLMRDNICFIASVVLLMRVSICCVCFSV